MQEHSQADAPRTHNVRSVRDKELIRQLQRCSTEIAEMETQHDVPALLVTLGVTDWKREQELIYKLLSVDCFPYEWKWKTRMGERYGQPCAMVAKGRMNSVLLEFPDGYRVVTSLNGIRRRKAQDGANVDA